MKSYASRKTFLSLIIVATVLCPVEGQQRSSKSLAESNALLGNISSKGAAAVVKSLNRGNGGEWQRVIRNIETGSPAWLRVANKLLTATDAGRTSDVYFALSLALTRNAAGVLSMVGPNVLVDRICSVPYIEPDEKTVRTYRLRARSAISKVTSAGLDPQKKACLNAVDQ